MTPEMKTLTNRCNTCPYWKHEAALQQRVKASLAGQPDVVNEVGLCYFNPPNQVMIPVPNPLDPRQVTMQSQRVFPVMLETEFCSHHPGRVLERERSLEFAREKARRDLVAYDPEKFPDVGFNHPPSLAAAKQMATVADARNTPHAFQGRVDRDCELCNLPDRAPIHTVKS